MFEDERVPLSIRLGAGLGLVYALMFAACLMNISDIKKAAGLAGSLMLILLATGYIWLNRDTIFVESETDFIEEDSEESEESEPEEGD